jgi:hypothetical protein
MLRPTERSTDETFRRRQGREFRPPRQCSPSEYCGKCSRCADLDRYLSRGGRRMAWPPVEPRMPQSSWMFFEEYLLYHQY